MSAFQIGYLVKVGRMYFCGLGENYEGYRRNGRVVVGPVFSTNRDLAYVYAYRTEAEYTAENFGGIAEPL